jgi:hypothetical protein
MIKDLLSQKKRGIICIGILSIVFYLIPGIWEDAKDDMGKKITYILCFAIILWSCVQAIYKDFFLKTN